jgi:hypothetical protein
MKYQDRVVIFIDILGFKELLNETTDKEGNDNELGISKVVEAYNSIRDVWDLDKVNKEHNFLKKASKQSKEITIFSDCIVISFPTKEKSEIFYTLLEVKWMILRLITKGILCRGAISYGKLLHNKKFLFGPALVEAYLLESKAANYPRIILDRSVIDLAGQAKQDNHTKEEEMEYVESLLEKDLDGMYYIDYFAKAQEELDDPQYDFPEYIQKLGEKIRQGMNSSKHSSKADIRVKYIWMKEKYNRMVEQAKNNKTFLNSLKERDEFDLYNFYKELKQINPPSKKVLS